MARTTDNEPTPGERINAAKVGEFVQLKKVLPVGSLQARRLKSGAVTFYWRYTLNGKSDRVAIGMYDSRIPPKKIESDGITYSIVGAEAKAAKLAEAHMASVEANGGGHRELKQAAKAEADAAKAQKVEAAKYTVKALTDAYCDHLKAIGRSSHRDARSIFTLHLTEPFPALANLPAKELTYEQVADAMRPLSAANKIRTANKLRAYLGAAFEVARKSRTNAAIPLKFKAFHIHTNPVKATTPVETDLGADRNPLTLEQFRAYWTAIKSMDGTKGALLRLHILTGAQRIEQLLRLKTADITADTIMLLDGKGRPGKPPRRHYLPLSKDAKAALEILSPKNEFAISLDGGISSISPATFSRWAKEAAAAIPGFKAKRLRSTVETQLASVGVSKDTRGRLQSHGISGVQAIHYDAHDYLPEKTAALTALYNLLTASPATNVVPLSSAA